jgi:hypothetical protein
VDVIEDFRQRRARGAGARGTGGSDLYVVSYDQAKAYDRCQLFTIQDSMRRFNMPPGLIQSVTSSLEGATSTVRTAHGDTTVFRIRSGVRQGDPLSPLLYALITDALHAGLRDNPLFPATATAGGYTFVQYDAAGNSVRICSAGYADDTIIVTDDPERLREMHAWLRCFFGAHSLRLNVDKTVYVTTGNPAHAPLLPSVDGQSFISPQGPSTVFRYLGLHLNLVLDWSKEVRKMDRAVQQLCRKMVCQRLTLDMSAYATKQYLLPRLRMGLLTCGVPDGKLRTWTKQLQAAALQGAAMPAATGLARPAVVEGTGLPSIVDHALALRSQEAMVTLLCDYPSSRSAWARLHAVEAASGGFLAAEVGSSGKRPPKWRTSRLAMRIGSLACQGVTLHHPPDSLLSPPRLRTEEVQSEEQAIVRGLSWRPDSIPVLYSCPHARPSYYTPSTRMAPRAQTRLGCRVQR